MALTPPPTATLSVLSSGAPAVCRTERQRSLRAHSSACGYAVRSVKRRTCGLPDRKATFAGAHSNSLRSLLSVFSANRLAALRKKRQRSLVLTPPPAATLSVLSSGAPAVCRTERQRSLRAHSNSLRSLLSVFSANRLVALRKMQQQWR